MTIVIEDGTGKSDAEAYISVADATMYFTNRGNASWSAIASDALREAYLRLATEYMTQVYRYRWQGARYSEDQALDWPREGVVRDSWQVDTDEVPVEVQRACAELALKASSGDLAPDLEQSVIREKVASIEVEYDKASPQYKRYRAIDLMLMPYLKGGGGCSFKLERV
jgi:hypothetical protein